MRTAEAPQQQKIAARELASPKAELIKARGGTVMTEVSGKPQPSRALRGTELFVHSFLPNTVKPVSAYTPGGCDGNDGSRGDGSCIGRCR